MGYRLGIVPFRLIARLDIKGPNLVKGIQLEGLRIIGDPHQHAVRYYEQGADELIYVDTVAADSSPVRVVRRFFSFPSTEK